MGELFLRGILIGLALAAPVGPIGALVIRRTLAEGRLVGLISGLGAATADAVYGLIGALGLTSISALLLTGQPGMRLAGGVFLCYLGLRTLRATPAVRPAAPDDGARSRAYLSTCLLTLSNPMTIVSFAAIFAGLGRELLHGSYSAALSIVLGVFIGSALWWLLLSGAVSLVRAKLTPRALLWVNRLSGAVIVVFGVLALAGSVGR